MSYFEEVITDSLEEDVIIFDNLTVPDKFIFQNTKRFKTCTLDFSGSNSARTINFKCKARNGTGNERVIYGFNTTTNTVGNTTNQIGHIWQFDIIGVDLIIDCTALTGSLIVRGTVSR